MWGMDACCQLRQHITIEEPELQRRLEGICKVHNRAIVLEPGLKSCFSPVLTLDPCLTGMLKQSLGCFTCLRLISVLTQTCLGPECVLWVV